MARPNASTRPAERAAAAAEIATPVLAATAAMSHALSEREAAPTPAPAVEADTPAPPATPHAPSSARPERAAAEAATPSSAAAAATSHSPRSAVPHEGTYGFISHGQSTEKINHLLQELVREGAVVFAMRGEMIGFGPGRQ